MLWPEFNVAELEAALNFFSSRERRFGSRRNNCLTLRGGPRPAGRPGRPANNESTSVVNDGLRKRIGTAVVLGGGFLAIALLLPAVATYIVLTLLILAGAWEWSGFLRLSSVGLRALYVAS